MYVCEPVCWNTIFVAGIHQHHQDGVYEGWYRNAVCCDSKYIYVIQCTPPILSVYNWTGTHLCDMNFKQLGIKENDYVHAISIIMRECYILLAVGDSFKCKYFHWYKIVHKNE